MRKTFLLCILFVYSCNVLFSQENIALNKSATASSSLGTNSPRNLNDGKSGTRWESVHGADNQWVEIDLGDVYDLTRSVITWEGAAASNYEMMVSSNSTDWRVIGKNTDTQAPRTDIFNFTNEDRKEVRYVRLDLKKRATTYGFSIYEWEVYGTLSNVTPTPAGIYLKPQNVTLLTVLPEVYSILSLNNSLIDYNDQPSIFNQLALSAGKTANWTKQTRLGKSLRYHYEEGDGITADGPSAKMQIRSKAWTHVILQEMSDKPLTDPTDFLASVKLWMQYIKEYCPNPNAKVIVTLNWAYTDASDFEGDTKTLYSNYKSIAEELGITICPVGNAYDLIYKTDGVNAKNALYSDNRHPTTLASYLSACLVYTTLFDVSPVGISYFPTSISAGDATRMQIRAWDTYQAHEDVVDDAKGIVHYSYSVLDQFNRPMNSAPDIQWSVNEGGSIDNGIFTSNGNEGNFVVTAQMGSFSVTANILATKTLEPIPDNYFAEISNDGTYAQDFDNLSTEATATLPIGWKIEKRTDAPRHVGSYSTATKATEQIGGNDLSSSAKNGLYNFGAGDGASAEDRAIGGISTGATGGTRCVNIFLKIKNTGDSDIQGLDLEYDVEKYRKGMNVAGFTLQMYYSTDGETWTSAGDDFRTFFSADATAGGYPLAPGDSRHVHANLSHALQASSSLFLAWNYSVASGIDAQGAQALGIDNVIVKTTNTVVADYASVSYTEKYTQDFDAIGPNAITTLPLGWKIEKRLDTPRKVGTYASAVSQTEQTGGNNMASNAKNGIYNFGAGDAATATDRAIGGISTGIADGTRCVNIYLKIKNTGETNMPGVNIKYDVEKYRKGANAAGFVFQMYYSTDGKTWISAGDNFTTFFRNDNETNGYATVPGETRTIDAILVQELKAGQELYLAWNYSVASGTDAQGAQALGIDNVEIKSSGSTVSNYSVLDESIKLSCYNKMLRIEGNNIRKAILYTISASPISTFETGGSFDLSGFAAGIYFVKVIDYQQNIRVFKIIN